MRRDTGPWLPGAVAVLAIAAMAVTARRDGPLQGGVADGLWQGARPAVALAAVVLLGVVAAKFAKHRDDGYGLLHRAGTATAVLLAAAAVLTPLGLLFLGRKPLPPPVDQQQPEDSKGTPSGHLGPGSSGRPTGRLDGSVAHWIELGLLFLILAAAAVLIAYAVFQLLSRLWAARQPLQLLTFDSLTPELEQLAEAVAAGTEALEYEGDAREAVIACYSAMEVAVSADGGGRRPTDTPEEFLRRVTAANLIPEAPARRLTDLFREARFSRHRIGEEQRDAAREALRAISEHLRSRAAAMAAEAARAEDAQARPGASAPTGGRR
jgi:hypothetical protein